MCRISTCGNICYTTYCDWLSKLETHFVFFSALLQISCHSFQYPLGVYRLPEGYKKQKIWRVH